MKFFFHIRKLDLVLTIAAALLAGIGLVSLYSSSISKGDFANFHKQIIFFLVGFFLMILVSFVDWRLLRNDPYFILLLYGIGVLALMGIFFFAPQIRGIKAWYRVAGISIDPIEYMKIVLVVLMAKFFSARHAEMYKISHVVLSGLYAAIPAALAFLQPNLGSASILIFLWIVLLLVSGIKVRHFFILVLIGMVMSAGAWLFLLKGYQKNRIISFVVPSVDQLGMGWSQLQARVAIGNGGLLGAGIGKGTQTQYGFLSEPQTDFIFSAVAEEFGFAGIAAVIGLFGLVIWRVLKIGVETENNFSRLFATGLAGLLIIQTGINIGMNIGLLPIVGIPLPLLSYGGSSLIMTYIGFGILQSMHTRAKV